MSKSSEILKATVSVAGMIFAGYILGRADGKSALHFHRKERTDLAKRVYHLTLHDDIREELRNHVSLIEAKEAYEKAELNKYHAKKIYNDSKTKMVENIKNILKKNKEQVTAEIAELAKEFGIELDKE